MFAKILKSNPNHVPAGSPQGGQFTSGSSHGSFTNEGKDSFGRSRMSGEMIHVNNKRKDGRIAATHVYGNGKRLTKIYTPEQLQTEINRVSGVSAGRSETALDSKIRGVVSDKWKWNPSAYNSVVNSLNSGKVPAMTLGHLFKKADSGYWGKSGKWANTPGGMAAKEHEASGGKINFKPGHSVVVPSNKGGDELLVGVEYKVLAPVDAHGYVQLQITGGPKAALAKAGLSIGDQQPIHVAEIYPGAKPSANDKLDKGKAGKAKKEEGLAHLFKGGSGSGNFNHSGRPGEIGGSSSDGQSLMSDHEMRRYQNAIRDIPSMAGQGMLPLDDSQRAADKKKQADFWRTSMAARRLERKLREAGDKRNLVASLHKDDITDVDMDVAGKKNPEQSQRKRKRWEPPEDVTTLGAVLMKYDPVVDVDFEESTMDPCKLPEQQANKLQDAGKATELVKEDVMLAQRLVDNRTIEITDNGEQRSVMLINGFSSLFANPVDPIPAYKKEKKVFQSSAVTGTMLSY